GNLDIVDANAGAADHLQLLGLGDDLRGRLGGGANGKAIIVTDDLGKLVLVLAEVGLEVDVDATVLEDLDLSGRERVGTENFCFVHWNVPLIGMCSVHRSRALPASAFR